jgi:hypothetical protein
MFNSKDAKVETSFKPGKYVNIGPNELKITKLDAVKSKAGDKFKVVMYFESKPVTEDGFEGQDGALGRVGKVDLSIYTTGKDQYIQDAINKLATIATELDLRDQLDGISAGTITEYLSQVEKVFKGKYAWWMIGGEEYLGKDADGKDKVKFFIKLPMFSFVAKTQEDLLAKQKDKIWPNKETDGWFFKKLVGMDAETTNKNTGTNQPEQDQLPF